MSEAGASHFDQAAADWDNKPQRIALMKAVGEAIVREARPTGEMDLLDYGCGTGLVGLFLLPRVRSVTGADSSQGMLAVLGEKIEKQGLAGMRATRLNLEQDPVPQERYHRVVSSMVMHHVADVPRLLAGFHQMLLPGGMVCIADLDSEPGTFHGPDVAGVHHHGFDRRQFKEHLGAAGFADPRDVTAHVLHKPVDGGELREYPVFLIVARRAE